MKRTAFVLAAVAVLSAAVTASAYIEVVDFATVNGSLLGDRIYSHAFEGADTFYAQLYATGGAQDIVKMTRAGGVWSQTHLLDKATWASTSGASGMTTFYGFGVSGGYVQFPDTSSDAIWRLDSTTGALAAYVTAAQIQAGAGGDAAQLLSPATVGNDGETYFYEGNTDGILKTTGVGTVASLATDLELTAVFGNDRVSGGMTMDAAGTLYWGNSTSDGIGSRAADGTLAWALEVGDITAVTGETAAGFGDFKFAPDGNVYFYESTSDGIMRFDPANAAGSLEVVLSEQDLLDGPAGSDNVGTLGWYDDGAGTVGVSWTKLSGTGGVYAVPEPATLAWLAAGAVVMVRRRRRCG